MISQAADQLKEKFPMMFSPSQNCRSPNLNIDNLRDAIFASNMISRHTITSSKQLMDWMMNQNHKLHDKYNGTMNEMDLKKYKVSKAALEKAKTNSFYLGLESTWLYE